ncbi:4'-phosphopantetheinyl transferase family protein [Nodosilinea nodulosa]|uniref:4'-phosphopantetheinyl transferase family protein n=1 Tax=Nodosilinea nodulosa TaxID=416001 RepID=UPI0002DE6B8B|nr:4'-phosphopantetheinyl transferase superfamily protein [Nodosilinea nodulosa]
MASALSAAEQAQLQRLRLAAAQRQFVLSRGCLRYLLSRYTSFPPASLSFVYGPRGKPALGPDQPDQGLAFNLSHSGPWLLIGVSVAPEIREIGVDIEVLRAVKHLPGLCRRYLTPTEAETVLAQGTPQADHQFLRYWTGKEACLKALGLGIANSMQTMELTLKSDGPASDPAPIAVATDSLQRPGQLYQWQPNGNCLAAIAVQSTPPWAALTFRLKQTTPVALAP